MELANDVNDHMPSYVVRRIMVSLNRRRLAVNGSRILLWDWPTSATPGTPVSRRRWWWPIDFSAWALRCAPLIPKWWKAMSASGC